MHTQCKGREMITGWLDTARGCLSSAHALLVPGNCVQESGVPGTRPNLKPGLLAFLQCGMARLPNNPSLRVMYANYLIEVRKDGQAARTQMQLAQKANPSVLESYSIFVVHQVAKQLKTSELSLSGPKVWAPVQ